jgi:hypothetical protein
MYTYMLSIELSKLGLPLVGIAARKRRVLRLEAWPMAGSRSSLGNAPLIVRARAHRLRQLARCLEVIGDRWRQSVTVSLPLPSLPPGSNHGGPNHGHVYVDLIVCAFHGATDPHSAYGGLSSSQVYDTLSHSLPFSRLRVCLGCLPATGFHS